MQKSGKIMYLVLAGLVLIFTMGLTSAGCVNQDCDMNPRDGIIDVGKSCTGTFNTTYWSTRYGNATYNISFGANNWGWVYSGNSGEWIYKYNNGWYWAYGNCEIGTYPRFIWIYAIDRNTPGGRWAYGLNVNCSQNGRNYCANRLVNGLCGTTWNNCTKGTLWDINDSDTNYLWKCLGLNGGANASCSLPILPPYGTNQKNISKYSNREVFLVSDRDWKNVLPWVSALVWTANTTEELQNCVRPYGGANNTCAYPLLIYHEEIPRNSIDVSTQDFSFYPQPGFSIEVVSISKMHLVAGENLTIIVRLTNDDQQYSNVYYIGLNSQNPYISLTTPSSSYVFVDAINPGDYMDFEFNFTFLGNSGGFDADSIIYFMQQYQNGNEKVTLIGDTPQELDNLLIAQPELGAGINQYNLFRTYPSGYLSYWKSSKDVVYVEDNYELALLASTYASLINAPLVIKNSAADIDGIFARKNVICVGNLNRNCNHNYTPQQLQQQYLNLTRTNKIILVNPGDLNIKVIEQFQPDKSSDSIYNIYGKTSLASPILAGAKQELIISTNYTNYLDIDNFLTSKLYSSFNITNEGYSICALGDSCSSGFELKTKEVYASENSLKYNISISSSSSTFTVCLVTNLLDCDGIRSVEIYNAGSLIGQQSMNCVRNSSIFFGVYTSCFQVDNLRSGELEFRVNGAKFAMPNASESSSWLNIYDYDSTAFECIVDDNTCTLGLSLENITGAVANTTSNFNFHTNPTNEYYLSFSDYPNTRNIQNFSVYVNGIFVVSLPSWQVYDYKIKIPHDLITNRVNVTIIPILQDSSWRSSEESIYYISPVLEPLVELPYFLTIIASPEVIPLSRPSGTYYYDTELQWEVDGRIYGSLNNNRFINLPTGRIMGITLSDVSSYMSRDLFFDKLPKNRDALIVVREDYQDEIFQIGQEMGSISEPSRDGAVLAQYARRYFWTNSVRNQFQQEFFYSGNSGVDNNQSAIYGEYDKVYLRLFDNHGWTGGFAGMMDVDYLKNNKIYLKPGFVLGLACSTCGYVPISLKGDLFCTQGIRRGILAQQGAIDVSYWHQEFDDVLNGTILDNETIGEAYLTARNNEYIDRLGGGDNYYAMLGDPTWRPRWW